MIHLTSTAIQEIQRLQAKTDAAAHCRLAVVNDGCAGLAYKMQFEPQVQPTDRQFNHSNLSIVVDPQSLEQIQGLEIDYTEDLMGGGFQFSNPQAKRTCSCGISFSISADNTNEWQVDCGL